MRIYIKWIHHSWDSKKVWWLWKGSLRSALACNWSRLKSVIEERRKFINLNIDIFLHMQSDQKTKNKTINSGSKSKDLFTELSKTLLHIEHKIRKNMTNLVSPYLCAWAHIFYLPNLADWRSNEIYLAGYNHFVFVWICTCTLIPLRLQTWKKYIFWLFSFIIVTLST